MSQSSDDTFPTAMHIASVIEIEDTLLPALKTLSETLQSKAEAFRTIRGKIGRTHYKMPHRSRSDRNSAPRRHAKTNERQIKQALEHVTLGDRRNSGRHRPERTTFRFRLRCMAAKISDLTGKHFLSAPNKFQGLTSHDALLGLSGALKVLAANLMKIARHSLAGCGSGAALRYWRITPA